MSIATVEISVPGSVPSSVEIEGGFGPQIVEINQGPSGPNSISTSTTTTLNGLLKGNGTNVAVATAGTDYLTPSGNAATATALQTARNIFGISFDGTANVSGDAVNNGHFASVPTGGQAGHFVTLNGTAPTVIAGRSAWYSDSSGKPSFRNGTGATENLIRTNDLGTGVATFLSTPTRANFMTAVTGGKLTRVFQDNTEKLSADPDFAGQLAFRRDNSSLLYASGVQTGDWEPIAFSSFGGFGAGIDIFLATPTSANLAAAITNETGSGSLVFATSPTLVTPILGTPTSGTLTNCTGYSAKNLADVQLALAATDLVRAAGVSGNDLTATVASGKTYRVNAMVRLTGSTGGSFVSSISGPNCSFGIAFYERAGFETDTIISSLTPLGTGNLHSNTGATSQTMKVEMVIKTSASGTIAFGWTAVGASGTRLAGSYLRVELLD